MNTIYISRFNSKVKEEDINQLFCTFGNIISIKIMKSGEKSYCYLEFDNIESSEHAIFNMNNYEAFDSYLKVEMANPNLIKDYSKAIWQNVEINENMNIDENLLLK